VSGPIASEIQGRRVRPVFYSPFRGLGATKTAAKLVPIAGSVVSAAIGFIELGSDPFFIHYFSGSARI
jgi:hypothetical protein